MSRIFVYTVALIALGSGSGCNATDFVATLVSDAGSIDATRDGPTDATGLIGDCSVTQLIIPPSLQVGDPGPLIARVENVGSVAVSCEVRHAIGEGTPCGSGLTALAGFNPGQMIDSDLDLTSFSQCGAGTFTYEVCATSIGPIPGGPQSVDVNPGNDCMSTTVTIAP